MTRPSIAMLLAASVLAAACGDDGSGDGTTSSSTTTGTDTTADTNPPDSTGTTDPSTSTTSPSTTSGSTSTDSGTADSTGTTTGTDTDGLDCEALAPGPLAVETVFEPGAVFSQSEDIAFDGQGHMVGKNGSMIVAVDAAGVEADSWPDNSGTYGLRYRANGDLLAAKYMLNQIRIVQSGNTLVGMVGGVNGLYPDFDGNVWFTNFTQVQRVNQDDTIDVIVSGPEAGTANGVVLDPDRGLLFYTNYGPGFIRSVEIMGDGTPGAITMVASIPGSSLDGLSLDACGNLYVVDQGGSALWRVFLDDAGAPIGDPEELVADFPQNVANAVFGLGDGWDELSLYVAGVPGGVYRVEIGVPGAPYPTP